MDVIRWIINWKGFGRLLFEALSQQLAEGNDENNGDLYKVDVPAKIRNKNFPNTNFVLYYYSSSLDNLESYTCA
jgi:hypothetical protein